MGGFIELIAQFTQPPQFLPLLRLLQLSFQFNEHRQVDLVVDSFVCCQLFVFLRGAACALHSETRETRAHISFQFPRD